MGDKSPKQKVEKRKRLSKSVRTHIRRQKQADRKGGSIAR